MMWYGDHMNGWGYAFMGLNSLLFWALLIVGGIALFRYLARSAPGPSGAGPDPSRSTAEQILADRYARGEIDDDEYHRRLDTLRGSRRTTTP